MQKLLSLIEDPLWFSKNVLGGSEPWEKQAEVMRSVRDNPRTAVKSGHGVGKTWTAARILLWFLTAYRPSRVITTAPTWQQVEKLLWAEIATQYQQSKVAIGGDLLQTQLKITDDHFAIGYSTNEATRFQGHHSEHILIIFDEASGVLPDIWLAAEGLLTNEHARFLVIGNPTTPVGDFYNCFKSPLWNKITISCYDCPNVVQDKIVYPRLVTKQWVEERKLEWGESSPEFKGRVLGEFPVEGEDTLIPLTWVERAIGKQILPTGADHMVLGIDVARYGDDRTAFQVLSGPRQVYEHGYQGKNTTQTVGRAVQLIDEYHIRVVAVDDSGVGGGAVDQLSEQLPGIMEKARADGWLKGEDMIDLIPVNFGSKAQDDERFDNLKAEIYWMLRLDFEQGVLALTKGDNLLSELPTVMYEVTSKGKLKIVSKDRMKKLGLHSPDYADALVIAHYASYAGRTGILDFYRNMENHEPTTTLISQFTSGSTLEEAFRTLTGK